MKKKLLKIIYILFDLNTVNIIDTLCITFIYWYFVCLFCLSFWYLWTQINADLEINPMFSPISFVDVFIMLGWINLWSLFLLVEFVFVKFLGWVAVMLNDPKKFKEWFWDHW